MKILQAISSSGERWTGRLQRKERSLREKGTTLYRDSKHKWKHTSYPGWIAWEEPVSGMLVARIQTHAEGQEWQILNAFLGYLNRHFGKDIESIQIYYR